MTRLIRIGNVEIGAGRPVAIQSMTKTDTRDVAATIKQIEEMADAGCEIVRLAVVDAEAAAAVKVIKRAVGSVPLVADIHFDYRLALECIKHGIDKIRINPGNIGDAARVKAVADAAKERGIPIRVGVNGGSLEKKLYEKYGGLTAEALAESALLQAELLRNCGFDDIVVSIKSSDVFMTVNACRVFHRLNTGIPQHIGITEAGGPVSGLVKSTIGLYDLLKDGIGDTIRVSLTADPVEEIVAAKALLRAVFGNKYANGVEMVSCPTCGRCRTDMANIARRVERLAANIHTNKRIKVAVMGCAVNGPGEAREADVGVSCGDGKALLFKHGVQQYQIPENEIFDVLYNEILELAK